MLRHRRKPGNGGARARKQKTALRERTSGGLAGTLLDVLGVRRMRADPPRSEEERREWRVDVLIAGVFLLVTAATRFYRLAVPSKIGK